MGECKEIPQNGNNEITLTKIRDPEKERAIRCLRLSFLFPVIITLAFCMIDIAAHYKEHCAGLQFNNSQTNGMQVNDILKWIISIESLGIILGYFSVTLITMALFMFIQQFYFRIYAGLDENKALTMMIIAVVNLIFYPVYIGGFFDSYCMTFIVFFLVCFLGVYIWRSLSADVRSFSKYPSHKGGPKAFISSNC